MVFTGERPIFHQLADHLADEILRLRYAEGEQVPSTNELAAFYRINPATAGKALNLLVDDQVLEKRRGIGMFVADGAVARLQSTRTAAFVQQFVKPLAEEAKHLEMNYEEVLDLLRAELKTKETQ